MGQNSILAWLSLRRVVDARLVFRISDIAAGAEMNVGNTSKRVKSLVKVGMVEEVVLHGERSSRYRISLRAFEALSKEAVSVDRRE